MPKTYIAVTAPIRLTLFLYSHILLVCFIFRAPFQNLDSICIDTFLFLSLTATTCN